MKTNQNGNIIFVLVAGLAVSALGLALYMRSELRAKETSLQKAGSLGTLFNENAVNMVETLAQGCSFSATTTPNVLPDITALSIGPAWSFVPKAGAVPAKVTFEACDPRKLSAADLDAMYRGTGSTSPNLAACKASNKALSSTVSFLPTFLPAGWATASAQSNVAIPNAGGAGAVRQIKTSAWINLSPPYLITDATIPGTTPALTTAATGLGAYKWIYVLLVGGTYKYCDDAVRASLSLPGCIGGEGPYTLAPPAQMTANLYDRWNNDLGSLPAWNTWIATNRATESIRASIFDCVGCYGDNSGGYSIRVFGSNCDP